MNKNEHEKQRKSANLKLADPGKSNTYKRIRKDNEQLINRLRILHEGPFGIWRRLRK
ncbi:hypothetical protein [Terribacillus saccharophilus]|uniref:hypothetical protein n=1 Tax=Terribacillus saccharophilus TaxID=361277 RepID=UPI00159562C4|nr:hypothetical protein [Terribacillus saccharophilus]